MLIDKNLINFLKKPIFSVKTYLWLLFVLSKNQKEELLSNDLIQKFLEKDHKFPLDENDKFIEYKNGNGIILITKIFI